MSGVISELFGVKYPIIQGGMVWCSGWELASAVSNAGGLGLIGAGSMYPETLALHIEKCKKNTNKPFGVNLPLLYPQIEEHIEVILRNKVPIVFTSAGSPKKWTQLLKSHGVKVVHVVSSVKFAIKSEEAGVDAVVAEGFEAGGHNGREETTTLCLVPSVKKAINIPLIAAGGISCGKSLFAVRALGADGVQIGSRFAVSKESSAHVNFKKMILDNVSEGDTKLTLKELAPVRLVKNEFYHQVEVLYKKGVDIDELKAFLGKGRAKKGIFDGDLVEGELEIGQVASSINSLMSAEDIIKEIWLEYSQAVKDYKI